MTDKDVVDKAASLLGGAVRAQVRKGNRKVQYYLSINGSQAAAWMMTLYTLMGERRKAKIKECLDIWKSFPVFNGGKEFCKNGHPFSPENTFNAYWKGKPSYRGCRTCRTAYMKEYKKRREVAA